MLGVLYGTVLSDAVKHGLGHHGYDLDEVTRVGIEIAIGRGLGILIPWLVCLSFSSTLLLIIRGTRHDKVRWLIWFNVVIESAISLVCIIVVYSQCGRSDPDPVGQRLACRPKPVVAYVSYARSGMLWRSYCHLTDETRCQLSDEYFARERSVLAGP